jgi:hypothetical protein
MEKKKRVVISMSNISPEIQDAILKKYPNGYANHIIKVNKGNDEFFHAITVDTEDASYLIKVQVKIDAKPKDKNDLDELLGRTPMDVDDEKEDNSLDAAEDKDIVDDSTIDD